MSGSLDLGRALLRGRYMCASAHMEAEGVPVDVGVFQRLVDDWRTIRNHALKSVNQGYGNYRGERFNEDAFEAWLDQKGINRPQMDCHGLDISDDALREMMR